MGEPLGAILVALIGAIGAYAVARVSRPGPPVAPPTDDPPPAREQPAPAPVAVQVDRAAAGLDAVLDELVEKRAELQQLRRNVWRCEVEHCPVRDRLRTEDAS